MDATNPIKSPVAALRTGLKIALALWLVLAVFDGINIATGLDVTDWFLYPVTNIKDLFNKKK